MTDTELQALLDAEESRNRVTFEDGCLDEVVTNGGAHLEFMHDDDWFLSMARDDGSEYCIWFTGVITTQEEREPPKRPHVSKASIAADLIAANATIDALSAERDALRDEVTEWKSTASAYIAISLQYDTEWELPDKHILPHKYDLLEAAGARMVDFTRANFPNAD